jgi:hypothetical protein
MGGAASFAQRKAANGHLRKEKKPQLVCAVLKGIFGQCFSDNGL